jgi:hypothetical protein
MKKEKRKPKINLIPSHVNHTFFILDLQIGPHAFKHTYCTLRKNVFFNVKDGSIQGSICWQLVPGLLVLAHLSKMTLSL